MPGCHLNPVNSGSKHLRRPLTIITAALICAVLFAAAPATAEPVQETQCADPTYAKLHPTICPQESGAPFLLGGGQPTSGGQGGGGGLLGSITGILGHLGL